MKSTDDLSPRRRAIWDVVRVAIPRKARWFYEGHPALRGQLWYAERRLLYETVRRYRPEVCFEIGTWRGGGSTLFIAQALHDNGSGVLHTIEIDRAFFDDAKKKYAEHLPHLERHVTFHLGDYREEYGALLQGRGSVDFVILDGAEDADETVRQYTFFHPYLRSGSVLMAHDWFTEKARLLRPIIEDSREWSIQSILGPPASIGFAIAVKK